MEWVERSFEILDEPMDTDDFIAMINQCKLETPGKEDIMKCILFRLQDQLSSYRLFMHGSHTIMDACPTFTMTSDSHSDIMSATWGTEWTNLPPGPIASTGGPHQGADAVGLELLGRIKQAHEHRPVSHSLIAQQTESAGTGLSIRVHNTINPELAHDLLKEVKALGCTVTHLFGAVQILAIFELNPVTDEQAPQANITFPISIISLQSWLTPEIQSKDRFISQMTLVPLRINYLLFSSLSLGKEQLSFIMQSLKDQWNFFLTNPHLPHLSAALMTLSPPRKLEITHNPLATTNTNLGVVDAVTPTVLYPNGDSTRAALIKIHDMAFGHRLTMPNPLTYAWTMKSEIVIQVEVIICLCLRFKPLMISNLRPMIFGIETTYRILGHIQLMETGQQPKS
ncbi:hypothetical protein EDD18DRAFT_1425905 [Armillaria luteobubalina]|uniref:Uncharacterized protein n=1 Tax=Armillaria luteobubalina TaxID=153913 RepID=A0AA39PM05_9AGAR|nr:hypothetical protein EDD18DRAFT_1425905 [Armillaria luteobubalina]